MTYVAAGIGVATTAYGAYQTYKGGKKSDKARAGLEAEIGKDPIPEAHKERLKRLKMRESTDMPGLSTIEENIGASTAQGVTAFKEMGNQANFQDFISQSIQNEQDQLRSLGIKAAEYDLSRQKDTDSALTDSASYEEEQQRRKEGLLESDLAAGEAEKGAGIRNITSGITTGATALANKPK